jgi:hypothetical protein
VAFGAVAFCFAKHGPPLLAAGHQERPRAPDRLPPPRCWKQSEQ